MIRHSPSGANKLNYLQHDKLNAPISAAITLPQAGQSKEGNIFLIIVPVTIGVVIAIILFSLLNYLKKMPDIPDLTDQCLIVQQIKQIRLAELEANAAAGVEQQNLIMNPLADENLDIDTIICSTVKLAKSPANQTIRSCVSQLTKPNQTNTTTIAQLNEISEIYHPVVKGPHTHSHLLIKPTVQKDECQLNKSKSLNCENKPIRHNHHNLSTFYLNNKAQLEYEHTAFGPQNWPVNCCETCPCNQTHQHRTPD